MIRETHNRNRKSQWIKKWTNRHINTRNRKILRGKESERKKNGNCNKSSRDETTRTNKVRTGISSRETICRKYDDWRCNWMQMNSPMGIALCWAKVRVIPFRFMCKEHGYNLLWFTLSSLMSPRPLWAVVQISLFKTKIFFPWSER